MRRDWGGLIHLAVAFAVTLVLLLVGAIREWIPHGPSLSPHQLWEALAWCAGAGGAAILVGTIVVIVSARANKKERKDDGSGDGSLR